MEVHTPHTELELSEIISAAKGPFAISGLATKSELGRPMAAPEQLSLAKFSGVTVYEPEELILEAGAATRLDEVLALLDSKSQMLAFEPPDFSAVLGSAHAGSLGGLLATGFAGSRRIKSGSVRDHVLGVRGVSGRGEIFKAGARVVKNVTGYDMPKLMAGSFGTLAALTSVTFKVLPRPEMEETLVLRGLSDRQAMQEMSRAMQSPYEVSGAAHVPGEATYLRLEGISVSVQARRDCLGKLLGRDFGILEAVASRQLWSRIRDCRLLVTTPDHALWRMSVPPMQGADVAQKIAQKIQCQYYFDWAGGLLWLSLPCGVDASAGIVRDAMTAGHAFLFKAPAAVRLRVPVFQPQLEAVAALSGRLKHALDPHGKLNLGRMYEAM